MMNSGAVAVIAEEDEPTALGIKRLTSQPSGQPDHSGKNTGCRKKRLLDIVSVLTSAIADTQAAVNGLSA